MNLITSTTVLVIVAMAIAMVQVTMGIIDPDENRSVPDIITSRGFKCETHYITTYDGYILAIHRIVNPYFKGDDLKPVILQHGLIASSADFLINSGGEGIKDMDINSTTRGNDLGFMLAKNPYDVWLFNVRGNTYCRNHTYLNPNTDKAFWEFTWDEHALIDLPTSIDYVRNVTSRDTVGYVGHSQGTLIAFALLSTKSSYNDVLKPLIALAPIGTVGNIKSPIRMLASNPVLLDFFKWRGGQFLPSTETLKYWADRVCESRYVYLCSNLLFLFNGFDIKQLNMTRLPVYFSHTPAGTSAWNLVHYAQQVTSKRVLMYDYGRRGNLIKYGTDEPPEYQFEKITNPFIALMNGLNDWLSDVKDVDFLRHKLKVPLVMNYTVPAPTWNHMDFIWGKDTGSIINSKVLQLLDQYA